MMHFEVTIFFTCIVSIFGQEPEEKGFQFNDFLGKLQEYVAPVASLVGAGYPNSAPAPASSVSGLGAAGNPNLLNRLGIPNQYNQPQSFSLQQQLQDAQRRAHQHQNYAGSGFSGYSGNLQQSVAQNILPSPLLNLNNLPPPTQSPILFRDPSHQSQQTLDIIKQLTRDNNRPTPDNSLLQNFAAANAYQNQALFTARPIATTPVPSIGDLTSANGFALSDLGLGGSKENTLLQTLIGAVGNQLGKPALGGAQPVANRYRGAQVRYPPNPLRYRAPRLPRYGRRSTYTPQRRVNERRTLTPKYARRTISNLGSAPVRRPTNIANSAPQINPFSEHKKAINRVPDFGGEEFKEILESRVTRKDTEPYTDLETRVERAESESSEEVTTEPETLVPLVQRKKQETPVESVEVEVESEETFVLPQVLYTSKENDENEARLNVKQRKTQPQEYRKTIIDSGAIADTYAPGKDEPKVSAQSRLQKYRAGSKKLRQNRPKLEPEPEIVSKESSSEPTVIQYQHQTSEKSRVHIQHDSIETHVVYTTTLPPTTLKTAIPPPPPIRAALRSIAYRKSPIARKRFQLRRELDRVGQLKKVRQYPIKQLMLDDLPREQLVPNAIPKLPKGSSSGSREKSSGSSKPTPNVNIVPSPDRLASQNEDSEGKEEEYPLYSWQKPEDTNTKGEETTEAPTTTTEAPTTTTEKVATKIMFETHVAKTSSEIERRFPTNGYERNETFPRDGYERTEELPIDGFERNSFDRQIETNLPKTGLEKQEFPPDGYERARQEINDPDLGPVIVQAPPTQPKVIRSTAGISPLNNLNTIPIGLGHDHAPVGNGSPYPQTQSQYNNQNVQPPVPLNQWSGKSEQALQLLAQQTGISPLTTGSASPGSDYPQQQQQYPQQYTQSPQYQQQLTQQQQYQQQQLQYQQQQVQQQQQQQHLQQQQQQQQQQQHLQQQQQQQQQQLQQQQLQQQQQQIQQQQYRAQQGQRQQNHPQQQIQGDYQYQQYLQQQGQVPQYSGLPQSGPISSQGLPASSAPYQPQVQQHQQQIHPTQYTRQGPAAQTNLPTDRGKKFIKNSGLTVDDYVNKIKPNTYSNNAVQNLEKYFGALSSKREST